MQTSNGSPTLPSPNIADARTQGGAAEPRSAQQPGTAALFRSLSTASNGPLPRLNLRSVSLPENSESTLSISRYGPKPETGLLGVTHRGPPPKRPYEVPPSVPEVPSRTQLVIELVSPAFTLEPAAIAAAQAAGTDLSAAALQRASTGLGVDRSALRLFEMREVPAGAQLADDADRVAVAIIGSSAAATSPCDGLTQLLHANCRATRAAAPLPCQNGATLQVCAPSACVTPCNARVQASPCQRSRRRCRTASGCPTQQPRVRSASVGANLLSSGCRLVQRPGRMPCRARLCCG